MGAPDGRVREVDAPSGRRYTSRDGLFQVSEGDAAALKGAGWFRPNLGGRTSGGFRCPACGFASFFRCCSRCGGDCDKE